MSKRLFYSKKGKKMIEIIESEKEVVKSNECGGNHQTTTSKSNKNTASAVTTLVIKEVNKIEINGCLYEEIYNPLTEEAKFVYYDERDKKIKEVLYVDDGNIRYVPIVDDFIKKKVVILPTKALPCTSVKKLLKDIQSYIHKYLDISTEDEMLCSWTIPMLYLFDKLNIMIPYLRALGDTGCGKSRFLNVVGGISHKPMFIGGSVTPAIIYRAAEKWRGTTIIDEADWKDTDEYGEVTKILNCNEPNRSIIRCKGDDYDKLEAFNPWSPRVLATRRTFSDGALESRMLTIQMKETTRHDIPIVLTKEFYKEQEELRNKLLTFRLKNWKLTDSSIIPKIDLTGIEGRSQQIIYPIAIVFNHNQDILDELALIIKRRQGDLIKDRSSTNDGIIANVFLELFDNGKKNITSTDIMIKVQRKCPNVNAQSIGHSMKSLGFTTVVKNINGESKRCYNPNLDLIERIRKRYSLKSLQSQVDGEKLQELQRLQLKNIVGCIAGKIKGFGNRK